MAERFDVCRNGGRFLDLFQLELIGETSKSPRTMKYLIRILALCAIFATINLLTMADDLSKLEGKWTIKKTSNEGQMVTHQLEISKNKFKFRVIGGNDQVELYAEGEIKLSKMGTFSAVKFFNIKAGASADQVEAIDDDHEGIYVLDENTWTIAANFDKSRENQKPSADAYTRAK